MKWNRRSAARFGAAVAAIGVCLLLIQAAARIGFSRLLTRYAVAFNSLPAADAATQLTPADADAHRARAAVLNHHQRPAEAEASLETATSLRYRDDYLWLELGTTREDLADNEGALAAFDQAVRWAPHYAHTHWQRGNLKLRMGRYDEAFAELRQAAASNRKFFPNLIDLAWGLLGGDPTAMESLIQIKDDNDRLEFARFLARKGKGVEVIGQSGFLTTPLSLENRAELARLLVAAKQFREAFAIRNGINAPKELVNGGFEEPLVFNDTAFAWIVSRGPSKTKLAINVSEKRSGAKSLQISFDGEWNTATPLLSQTVVVEPGQRYRISFAVRTKDLVTGEPPRVFVSDAASDQVLAKSEGFPQSSEWQIVKFEFTTLPTSEAVVIRVQRNSCASQPCPIFGVVWLDDFLLEKV